MNEANNESPKTEAVPNPAPEEAKLTESDIKGQEVEAKFQALLEAGEIAVDPENPGFFIVARAMKTKEDAVNFVERLKKVDSFGRMSQLFYRNGMVDGVRTYRREIAKFGSETHRKCLDLGDQIIRFIADKA